MKQLRKIYNLIISIIEEYKEAQKIIFDIKCLTDPLKDRYKAFLTYDQLKILRDFCLISDGFNCHSYIIQKQIIEKQKIIIDEQKKIIAKQDNVILKYK